jgi:hypothetical protein
MWKATRQQGAVYLVGSVHMLTKDFYPLAPALDAGFKDSDLLVEEVDLAEMLAPDQQFALLARGMLPAGQTLDKVVSPATMALVNQHVGGPLPLDALKQFKPWFLAMTLEALEWHRDQFRGLVVVALGVGIGCRRHRAEQRDRRVGEVEVKQDPRIHEECAGQKFADLFPINPHVPLIARRGFRRHRLELLCSHPIREPYPTRAQSPGSSRAGLCGTFQPYAG